VEDEVLAQCVADGHDAFTNVSATSDLGTVSNDISDNDLLDAKVKLEISGIELDVTLGDLTDGSTVELSKERQHLLRDSERRRTGHPGT